MVAFLCGGICKQFLRDGELVAGRLKQAASRYDAGLMGCPMVFKVITSVL